MRLALLDTDIIIYRASVLNEESDLDSAISQYKTIRDSWLDASGCDGYASCMTKGVSFRKTHWPAYKESRASKPRPRHLQDLREYVRSTDNPMESESVEADDVIGMMAADVSDYIIVTVDKDMDQITGLHCNPDKHLVYNVDDDRAAMTWMMQILAGDATDNYPGLPGIGERKAFQMLEEVSQREMPGVVLNCYASRDCTADYLKRMIVCATIIKDIKWTEFSSLDSIGRSIQDTYRLFGPQLTGSGSPDTPLSMSTDPTT